MRIYLALYDQADAGPTRNYWSWNHPDLTSEILNRFYYEVIAPHRGRVTTSDLNQEVGGGGQLDEQWVGFYRFISAGRDTKGRLGRIVVVCIFVKQADTAKVNWSNELYSSVINEMAARAPTECPVSPPETFELPVFPDILKQGFKVTFETDTYLKGRTVRKKTDLIACISNNQIPIPWRCEWNGENAGIIPIPNTPRIPPKLTAEANWLQPIQSEPTRSQKNDFKHDTGSFNQGETRSGTSSTKDIKPTSKWRKLLRIIVALLVIGIAVCCAIWLIYFKEPPPIPAPVPTANEIKPQQNTEEERLHRRN